MKNVLKFSLIIIIGLYCIDLVVLTASLIESIIKLYDVDYFSFLKLLVTHGEILICQLILVGIGLILFLRKSKSGYFLVLISALLALPNSILLITSGRLIELNGVDFALFVIHIIIWLTSLFLTFKCIRLRNDIPKSNLISLSLLTLLMLSYFNLYL